MSEILTRLNPKVSNWGGGGGSFGSLTTADVCAALSGTSPIGRLALVFRYAGTISESDFDALHIKTLRYAIKHNWNESPKDSKQKRFKKLTRLCLVEHCVDPLCGTCRGTKYLYTKECPTCKGTGQGHYSTADRARMLGIARKTYKRTWEAKQKQLAGYFKDLLPELEYRAKRQLKQQLA